MRAISPTSVQSADSCDVAAPGFTVAWTTRWVPWKCAHGKRSVPSLDLRAAVSHVAIVCSHTAKELGAARLYLHSQSVYHFSKHRRLLTELLLMGVASRRHSPRSQQQRVCAQTTAISVPLSLSVSRSLLCQRTSNAALDCPCARFALHPQTRTTAPPSFVAHVPLSGRGRQSSAATRPRAPLQSGGLSQPCG